MIQINLYLRKLIQPWVYNQENVIEYALIKQMSDTQILCDLMKCDEQQNLIVFSRNKIYTIQDNNVDLDNLSIMQYRQLILQQEERLRQIARLQQQERRKQMQRLRQIQRLQKIQELKVEMQQVQKEVERLQLQIQAIQITQENDNQMTDDNQELTELTQLLTTQKQKLQNIIYSLRYLGFFMQQIEENILQTSDEDE